MSLLRYRQKGAEGNDRRGQDSGYTRDVQGRRANRQDREEGRGVRAHREEVREDGGPLAGDAQEEGAEALLPRGLRALHRRGCSRRTAGAGASSATPPCGYPAGSGTSTATRAPIPPCSATLLASG